MTNVVPEADDRFIPRMLVAQDAERCRAQEQEPPVRSRQSQPAGGQNPEEMAVPEQEDAALDRPQFADQAIGPCSDGLDRLAARTPVAKQRPARPVPLDVGGASARRTGRNPIPSGRARASPTSPKPASSPVRRARWSGLTMTFVNDIPRSRSPRLRALRSPRSVSGMSVRPVCWCESVQAVSPCRAR